MLPMNLGWVVIEHLLGLDPGHLARNPNLAIFIRANELDVLMPLYGHKTGRGRLGSPTFLVQGKPVTWPTIVGSPDKIKMDKNFVLTSSAYVKKLGIVPIEPGSPIEIGEAEPVDCTDCEEAREILERQIAELRTMLGQKEIELQAAGGGREELGKLQEELRQLGDQLTDA